jgi:hypothetical protein
MSKAPPPDLVFLDLNLDGENRGATTLEHFQAGNPSNVPVVVCTGLAPGNDDEVEILRMCMRDRSRCPRRLSLRGCPAFGNSPEYAPSFLPVRKACNGRHWSPYFGRSGPTHVDPYGSDRAGYGVLTSAPSPGLAAAYPQLCRVKGKAAPPPEFLHSRCRTRGGRYPVCR